QGGRTGGALELRLAAPLHPPRRSVLRLAVLTPEAPLRARHPIRRRASRLRPTRRAQRGAVPSVPPSGPDCSTHLRAELGHLDALPAAPQRLQSEERSLVLLQLRP